MIGVSSACKISNNGHELRVRQIGVAMNVDHQMYIDRPDSNGNKQTPGLIITTCYRHQQSRPGGYNVDLLYTRQNHRTRHRFIWIPLGFVQCLLADMDGPGASAGHRIASAMRQCGLNDPSTRPHFIRQCKLMNYPITCHGNHNSFLLMGDFIEKIDAVIGFLRTADPTFDLTAQELTDVGASLQLTMRGITDIVLAALELKTRMVSYNAKLFQWFNEPRKHDNYLTYNSTFPELPADLKTALTAHTHSPSSSLVSNKKTLMAPPRQKTKRSRYFRNFSTRDKRVISHSLAQVKKTCDWEPITPPLSDEPRVGDDSDTDTAIHGSHGSLDVLADAATTTRIRSLPPTSLGSMSTIV